MKSTIKIRGLDCAGCAAELEEELSKIVGVKEVNVSFVDQKIYLECETEKVVDDVKYAVNHFEEVQVLEEVATSVLENGATLLRIKNLHCAACALDLEDEIKKIKEVEDVQVDFLSQTILIKASEEGIKKAIKKANNFENVKVIDGGRYERKKDSHKKEWILIGVSAICFILGFFMGKIGGMVATTGLIFYAIAYFAVGYPVLYSTIKNCAKGKIFDENFLMTVASIGAVVLGQYSEGVLVMLLYQTGELLQAIAVGASRNSVTELMALKSERAYVFRGESYEEISPEELVVGDKVLLKAGEKIPADGRLLTGNVTLDVKSLTGESEPITLSQGDEVLSGAINIGGVAEIEIIRPYQESAVGKILELVENATAKKAAPEKFISKFARYYTPIVCALALCMVLIAPPVSGLILEGRFFYKDFGRWLESALTFLVISCPCALVISVPLTYFSGIGACAKRGILVKGATYLDELAQAKIFAFDKTGTLTLGDFSVCSALPANGKSEEELLAVIAAVESGSAHPIAKAFGKTSVVTQAVEEFTGLGLKGVIDGKNALVGSYVLMQENGIKAIEKESVYTTVYAALDGEYLGCVEVGDKVRTETKSVLSQLKETGAERLVMLTGDREERARKIGNEIGMYEINAGLLPDEKLKTAEELKKGGKLVYVGDGINDAPVMKAADCAVSMGKLGSAAAVEASDLVLVLDDLSGLVGAFKTAKKTRRIVMQNIVFSILLKVLFMALGVVGVLPLSMAVFADVGVMLLAVANSFRVAKQ